MSLEMLAMKNIFLISSMLLGTFLSAQDLQDCNCCSKKHKAFDFWIGEWEVVNSKDGSPAGHSLILKEEGGCVIREKWTSAKQGYTGTSLNFYNSQTQEWEQLWVDNSGAALKLKGNREGDQMTMTSDIFTKTNGEKYRNRITWTHNTDGTVRQLWEVVDEKNNATIAFDGLYRKVYQNKKPVKNTGF